MGAYLSILRCADGSYYAGTTRTSLEMRIAQHNDGTFGGYTSTRRPVVLVYHQEFDRITGAIAAERQVKRWTRGAGPQRFRRAPHAGARPRQGRHRYRAPFDFAQGEVKGRLACRTRYSSA